MTLRKKKKCSLCKIFTEGTVKFNGKLICLNCLGKLFTQQKSNDLFVRAK